MSAPGWSAFRHRDFRLFCAARFGMVLAQQLQAVAVAWLVYDLTRSPLALGLVGLAYFLPTAALVLVTGLAADQFDRRLILIAAYAVMAAAAAGMLLNVRTGGAAIWPIYALIIAVGAARSFAQPAGAALLPNLVPAADFANAVTWNTSAVQVASLAGPALGGLLYAIDAKVPFLVAAILLAGSAMLALALRPRRASAAREPVTWGRLVAGVSFIRSRPVVLGAISLDLFAVLLGGSIALLPVFAQDYLHVGPTGLGVLRSMPAFGAFAMTLVLAQSGLLARHAGRRMLIAAALFGLATIGFGLSRDFALSAAMLAITGAADMVSVVVRQTLVQAETPDELRGRVSAVNSLFIGASNEIGEFESGAVAWLVGAPASAVLGGLGTIAIAGLWSRLFPELRERDRLVPTQS